METMEMTERESAVEFHRDPLLFLDLPAARDAVWLPGRQLCVGEPAAARAVLTNGEGLYEDHSDFFHTRRGTFGPRPAQEQMGRASRALLRAHVAAHSDELAEAVNAMAAALDERERERDEAGLAYREAEERRRFALQAAGTDFAQGFGIAMPAPMQASR